MANRTLSFFSRSVFNLSQHVALSRLSKSSRRVLVNLLFTEQLLGHVLPELLTNT